MVEALPAVTYIDEPIPGDDLNAMMPFVSPQIEQILGYPPERFTQNNRFWFEIMSVRARRHPGGAADHRGAGGRPIRVAMGPARVSTDDVRVRTRTTEFAAVPVDVGKPHAVSFCCRPGGDRPAGRAHQEAEVTPSHRCEAEFVSAF